MDIPKRHIPRLAKLQAMPPDDFGNLIAALQVSGPMRSPEEMTAQVASMISQIPNEELREIIDTIYAMYFVRELSDASNSRFLSDLVQALKSAGVVSEADTKLARGQLQKLLSIDSVKLVAKALKLQRDGERLFCDAQILSDVRAIFHEDVTAKPSAAVIGHTLKLGYHENGVHKEFFVILERNDLEVLKEVVERAQLKEKTLQGSLDDAGIANISV